MLTLLPSRIKTEMMKFRYFICTYFWLNICTFFFFLREYLYLFDWSLVYKFAFFFSFSFLVMMKLLRGFEVTCHTTWWEVVFIAFITNEVRTPKNRRKKGQIDNQKVEDKIAHMESGHTLALALRAPNFFERQIQNFFVLLLCRKSLHCCVVFFLLDLLCYK